MYLTFAQKSFSVQKHAGDFFTSSVIKKKGSQMSQNILLLLELKLNNLRMSIQLHC